MFCRDQETQWALPSVPYAGNNIGFYFIPPLLLFYEGNTPMVNSGEEEGDGDLYEEIREQRVRVSLQD